MFSNSIKARKLPAVALTCLAMSLASCASTPSNKDAGNTTKLKGDQLVGFARCLLEAQSLTMDKAAVGALSSFYSHKVITGTLAAKQMLCDLGKPSETKTTQNETTIQDMPFAKGDRFLRWGDHRTNNPVDEMSIMVVVNTKGDVKSIAQYDTMEKTLARVSKVGDKIKVTTGTYTAVRTVTSQ